MNRIRTYRYMATLLLTMGLFSSFGQKKLPVEVHLKAATQKYNAKDYKGAIEAYGKVIKADKQFRDAYFNRGICKLALRDYIAAKADFDHTLELDPVFAKAYYARATALVSLDNYTEAETDLDRSIALDEQITKALTLRGQLRAQNGNINGAWEDFMKAREYGDAKADTFLYQFCINNAHATEFFTLQWPESLKATEEQENNDQQSRNFLRADETMDTWTELGNMTSVKGLKNKSMEQAMQSMFGHMKQYAPKARLTFIEKNEQTLFPWIMFTIEAPRFTDDKRPESQLWYIVQGKQGLYTNFRSVRQATLPNELKEQWARFFKEGKIIYR